MRLITRAVGASGGDGRRPASAHCNSHSSCCSLALKPLTPCRRQCPQPPSAASGREGGSGGEEGAAAQGSGHLHAGAPRLEFQMTCSALGATCNAPSPCPQEERIKDQAQHQQVRGCRGGLVEPAGGVLALCLRLCCMCLRPCPWSLSPPVSALRGVGAAPMFGVWGLGFRMLKAWVSAWLLCLPRTHASEAEPRSRAHLRS